MEELEKKIAALERQLSGSNFALKTLFSMQSKFESALKQMENSSLLLGMVLLLHILLDILLSIIK